VCAKILEFVLGRSMVAKVVDESGIAVRIIRIYGLLCNPNIGL
jgi:hypothetical protein